MSYSYHPIPDLLLTHSSWPKIDIKIHNILSRHVTNNSFDLRIFRPTIDDPKKDQSNHMSVIH